MVGMRKSVQFDFANLKYIKEICRFCLSNDGILLPLFGFKEGELFHQLPTQLKTFLTIEMEEGDGLPSLICHSCLYNMEKCINFKSQCEQADSILRNFLGNPLTKVESKDSSCQSELLEVTNESDPVPPEGSDENLLEEGGSPDGVSDSVESNTNTAPPLEDAKVEVEEKMAVEGGLQMEESMNELEEGMFKNEPFSLDLCSVRMQSESQNGTESATVFPTTQLTDEEQWSDSGSENSDEAETTESASQAGNCNCTFCNKAFTNMAVLLRHQLIHKQEPPYPCDYCDTEFDEKMLLKAHWRTHTRNRPHMCLTCGEAYLERSELVKHFAIHDMIKPYHCSGCGKAFAYRSDLRKHAIIHTGARPFKCPVCGKTFTRSTNLNKHARVHSGQRPYPCDHCNKMFSSRGDLVRHAVIHTGEKPYACLICSLAFNRKDKLSRHERVHITDRTFVCAECPTSFHRKEELTKHIRFHHFKPDPEYYNTLE